jgi:hypothetical protein
MNLPIPAEMDEEEVQAAFSTPPILNILTTKTRRSYRADSGNIPLHPTGTARKPLTHRHAHRVNDVENSSTTLRIAQ